ncbi:hypothetical protein C7H19_12675 [Aphanothece hegewaldii CCALA 016]|uniref:F5/8 type C domain-containing protein n=1 Tax=Aphanothece hegewaldii CCALA 016 TaxID=2107694 RepID=A0A2T1LXC0_9CHRO|nr:Calx-beta domain-containing protein [Aphanothece hegewaldii]PSF36815.1 hypothetical protein C7H19_12675 [Aphanothece hegewaldii CCALA 016]
MPSSIAFSSSLFSVNEDGTLINTITLTRSNDSVGEVSVTLTPTDGIATSPNDYNSTALIVNFANGETTKTVNIPIVNDQLREKTETINLTLSNPTNGATLGIQNTALLTIVDNENSVGTLLSQNLPSSSYTASQSWTSELSPDKAFDGDETKNWNAGNYATQWIEVDLGQVYSLSSIQLLIAQLPEGDTTHKIWVSNQPIGNSTSNATLASTFQSLTDNGQWLQDDFNNTTTGRYVQVKTVASPSYASWFEIEIYGQSSPQSTVSVSVSSTSVLENGTTNLVYTFSRTGSFTSPLTVNFSVAGTATFNTDYTQTGATSFNGTTGSITFAANSATKTLTLNPTGDTTIEPDETIALILTRNAAYNIGTTDIVVGTITNDDGVLPTLSINDITLTEGNSGTKNATFTITRTGTATQPITVNFATANGTATAGSDYTATLGSLTFATNETTKTINVPIIGDTTVEPNETFLVNLTNPTNATLADAQGLGTITNDDTNANVTLALDYSGISENSTTNFTYTFTRTGNLTNSLIVNINVAGTATFNTDYVQTGATSFSNTTGTITFAAGSATANLVINPTGDTTVEPNETVALTLTSGSEYDIGTTSTVTATIINDETRRQVATNGNDVILGSSKTDVIIGGLGNDTLTGGGNGDLFTFTNPNEGIDRITDFTPSDDLIVVKGSSFGGGLTSSDIIKATQFVIGTAATTAKHRFIYNSATGALLFDKDGTGTTAAIQFATLNTGLALTYEDIFVS